METFFKWFIFLAVVLTSCSEGSVTSEQEYLKYMAQEENGLSKTKVIGDYKITVKNLPAEYLVYKELKDKEYTKSKVDSLKALYKNSLTFLMTIAPSKEELNKSEGDIMYEGVGDYGGYKERVHDMNFYMDQYLRLDADDKTFHPVLATMENIYSLGNHRSVYVVFAEEGKNKELMNASQYDLIFEDDLFGTGINHFQFERKNLETLPAITFWQY